MKCKPNKVVVRKHLAVAKNCDACGETLSLKDYVVACDYFLVGNKLYPIVTNVIFYARCRCNTMNALKFNQIASFGDALKKMTDLGQEEGFTESDIIMGADDDDIQ